MIDATAEFKAEKSAADGVPGGRWGGAFKFCPPYFEFLLAYSSRDSAQWTRVGPAKEEELACG